MPLGGLSDLLMSIDLYEVRPRKDNRSVDVISDALPSTIPARFTIHSAL
jgi:hypothetical protein